MDKSKALTAIDFSDNYFTHYGVLGMKWGHHKNQNRSKTKTKNTSSSKSKAEKKLKKNRKAEKLVNSGIFAASALLAKTSLRVGSAVVKQSALVGEGASKPEWFVFPLSALGAAGGVAGMTISLHKAIS